MNVTHLSQRALKVSKFLIGSAGLNPDASGCAWNRAYSAEEESGKMRSALKITAGVVCGLLLGAGTVQLLHAQSKPPAFVVAEINVKDEEGYEKNFLTATQKDIADHGGKYLAGGYKKTMSLVGEPPPNRVVILQFANMDAVREWNDQGAMDMENTVGSKYASFRIYAVEGADGTSR
jgi:uncharacterized protein (DUF1330 family)